jgi:catechol 2,3-dioxygenase
MATQTIPEVKFTPRRLGHVNLSFNDFDKSLDFYINVCGLEFVYGKPQKQSGFVTNGNTHHDMGMSGIVETKSLGLAEIEGENRRKLPRLNHFAWEMENEVLLVEGWKRSQEAGVKYSNMADHGVSHALYTADPEKNGVEVYADATKDWRKIMNPQADMNITSKWMPGEIPPDPTQKYDPNPEIRRVEGAVFHPVRVAHGAIVAEDLESLVDYYTNFVGLHEAFRASNNSYVIMSGTVPGRDLTLFQATEGQTVGLHHIAFEMANEKELDDAEARMEERGMQAELKLDHATKRAVFIKDPDGLLVEFFVERDAPLSKLDELEPGLALHLA